jgi:hypothetical protein
VGGALAKVTTGKTDGLTYNVHELGEESLQVITPIRSELVQFIHALFGPEDWVLTRPIETWNPSAPTDRGRRVVWKHVVHMRAKWLTERHRWWERALHRAKVERANVFFGVCPRFGDKFFDRAFQVRCVRVLWADLDHCTPKEALQRCEKAGLPRPSVVVRSGHGTHLYWILAEPYLIDDAGKPPPIYTEFIKLPDGRNLPRHFIKKSATENVYEYDTDPRTGGNSKTKNIEWPDDLSPKAVHVQTVVQGIAAAIGGDHTNDLVRLLRFPCTLNRKDERNGKQPVPCELVECDPNRRYPLADFEKFAERAPARLKAKELAKVKLRSGVKLTAGRLNSLNNYINRSAVAEPGSRSGVDFALCCYALEHGFDKEAVWAEVQKVGKFEERGRGYFDLTWRKAEAHTREKIYIKSCLSTGGNPSRVRGAPSAAPADQDAPGPAPADPADAPDAARADETGHGNAEDALGDDADSPPGNTGGLPTIEVNERQLRDVSYDALSALVERNDPPRIFQRGGLLTRLRTRAETEEPYLETLAGDSVRGVLARVANWKKIKNTKMGPVEEDVYPPKEVVADLISLPGWDVRRPFRVHVLELAVEHCEVAPWFRGREVKQLATNPRHIHRRKAFVLRAVGCRVRGVHRRHGTVDAPQAVAARVVIVQADRAGLVGDGISHVAHDHHRWWRFFAFVNVFLDRVAANLE